MTTQTISDIEQAIRRIATGWGINYVCADCWEVYHEEFCACELFDNPDDAKAEYLRLTAAEVA